MQVPLLLFALFIGCALILSRGMVPYAPTCDSRESCWSMLKVEVLVSVCARLSSLAI